MFFVALCEIIGDHWMLKYGNIWKYMEFTFHIWKCEIIEIIGEPALAIGCCTMT